MNSMSEIFFSYAWVDNNDTKDFHEQIIDDLYESLLYDKFKVVRDKFDLGYKGLISEFTERIGMAKCIIIVISDRYLRSPYCMFELYEIARNSDFDKLKFKERVIPIAIEFIDFTNTKIISDYLIFWENEFNQWDYLVKKQASKLAIEQMHRYDKIKMIYQNIGKLMEWIIDINTLNIPVLSKNNFAEIKKAIIESLGDTKDDLEVEDSTHGVRKGFILYRIPLKMQYNNLHRCIIRIAFEKVSILKNITPFIKVPIIRGEISISKKMEVSFEDTKHFLVIAINSSIQIIEMGDFTEWNFDVRPLTLGKFPLTFRISAYLKDGSKQVTLTKSIKIVTTSVRSAMEFTIVDLTSDNNQKTLAEYKDQVVNEVNDDETAKFKPNIDNNKSINKADKIVVLRRFFNFTSFFVITILAVTSVAFWLNLNDFGGSYQKGIKDDSLTNRVIVPNLNKPVNTNKSKPNSYKPVNTNKSKPILYDRNKDTLESTSTEPSTKMCRSICHSNGVTGVEVTFYDHNTNKVYSSITNGFDLIFKIPCYLTETPIRVTFRKNDTVEDRLINLKNFEIPSLFDDH